MVFGWGESQEAYQQVYNGNNDDPPRHEAHKSHELIAGAASFEAVRLFEQHQQKEGKPVSHAFAKELLASFAGAEVDKLAETKGLDWESKERAHIKARESAHHMYDQQYGNQDQYDPSAQPPRANDYVNNNYNN